MNSKWTKLDCIKDAKKYSSRNEWRKNSNAYHAAHRNQWLDECCSHMPELQKKKGFWTRQECIKDARKHTTITNWINSARSGYSAARKNGWLEDCIRHMNILRRKPWTKKECLKSARKHKTKIEWFNKFPGAHNAAKKNGWIDECCSHMESRFWTKEECIKDAKKYSSRNQWSENSSAYGVAKRRGWFNECVSHMVQLKRQSISHSKKECLDSAKKFKSKADWKRGDPSTHSYAQRKGWLNECSKHMIHGLIKYSKQDCIIDARNYNTRTQWQDNSILYHRARENGWLDECCSQMTSPVKPKGFWDKENCIKDAKKYNTKKEWEDNSGSAYNSARLNGWMKECSSHMKVIVGQWTKQACLKAAKSCKTRVEWLNRFPGAHNAAQINGWYSQCVHHMGRPSSGSDRTIYWFIDNIKNIAYVGLTDKIQRRGNQHLSGKTKKSALADSLNKGNLEFYDTGIFYKQEKAKIVEKEICDYLKHQGYSLLNVAKPGGLGGNVTKWNKKNCIQEAKRFSSLKKWREESGSSYGKAIASGWKDACTSHMKNLRTVPGFWNNKDRCLQDAKKYNKRSIWRKKSSAAAKSAIKNGWFDECVSHMVIKVDSRDSLRN